MACERHVAFSLFSRPKPCQVCRCSDSESLTYKFVVHLLACLVSPHTHTNREPRDKEGGFQGARYLNVKLTLKVRGHWHTYLHSWWAETGLSVPLQDPASKSWPWPCGRVLCTLICFIYYTLPDQSRPIAGHRHRAQMAAFWLQR